MSVTPIQSTVTVTTAGTRVRPYSDTTILPSTVYIEALGTNTGFIYVGLSNVSSTTYIARLSAGQALSFTSEHTGGSAVSREGVAYQLSDFYLDSSVSGEKAQLSYSAVKG